MIETYKLLTGKYDQQVALALLTNVTGKYFTRGAVISYSQRDVDTNCGRIFQ